MSVVLVVDDVVVVGGSVVVVVVVVDVVVGGIVVVVVGRVVVVGGTTVKVSDGSQSSFAPASWTFVVPKWFWSYVARFAGDAVSVKHKRWVFELVTGYVTV